MPAVGTTDFDFTHQTYMRHGPGRSVLTIRHQRSVSSLNLRHLKGLAMVRKSCEMKAGILKVDKLRGYKISCFHLGSKISQVRIGLNNYQVVTRDLKGVACCSQSIVSFCNYKGFVLE